MFLKSIAVENFRSYRSATVDFIEPFTSIIGPNGSGKSNIVSAFLFAITKERETGTVTLSFSDFSVKKISEDGKMSKYFVDGEAVEELFYFNFLHDKKIDENLIVQQRGVDLSMLVENMLCITELSKNYNILHKERIKINKILKKHNLQCTLKKYNEFFPVIQLKRQAVDKIFMHKKRVEFEEHKNKNLILKDRLHDEMKILNQLENNYKDKDRPNIAEVRREQEQLKLELTSIVNLIFSKYGEEALNCKEDLSTGDFKTGNIFLFKKYTKKKNLNIEKMAEKYFQLLKNENQKINFNLKREFMRASAQLKNFEEEQIKFQSYIKTIQDQLNALPFNESDMEEIEKFLKKSKILEPDTSPFYERIEKYEQILTTMTADCIDEKNSVLNLMKFKSKHSTIISAGLGKNINALVVDTRKEAFDLYKHYKTLYRNMNCTLIIYDLESYGEKIEYGDSPLNPVFELISCEKKYENLFRFLLRDIFYAENLNCITDFNFKKIISTDGDVLHKTGIYTTCLPRPPKMILNHFLKNLTEIKGKYRQLESLSYKLAEYCSIERDLTSKISLAKGYITSLNFNGEEEQECIKGFLERYFIEGVSKNLLKEIFTENYEYDELKGRVDLIKERYDILKNIKEGSGDEKVVEEINLLIEKTNLLKKQIIEGEKEMDDMDIEDMPIVDLTEQYDIILDYSVFKNLHENFPRKFKIMQKKIILNDAHEITHNYLMQYREYVNAVHNQLNDEILKSIPPSEKFMPADIKKYEDRIKILNEEIKQCGKTRHEIVYNFFTAFTTELKSAMKKLIGDFSDISLKYTNRLKVLVKLEEKNFIEYKNLSGGEQQLIMIVFVCTLLKVQNYRLVIFDEVDGFLDGENLLKLSNFLREIFQLFNLQLVIVSHKSETYRESDALVGVYKKLESAILTLKL